MQDAEIDDDSDNEDGDGGVEGEEDEDDDDEDVDFEPDSVMDDFDTELDRFECEMQEYVTFYELMKSMESGDPVWYQRLVSELTDAQKTELKEVADTAMKCMQQKRESLICFLIAFLAE